MAWAIHPPSTVIDTARAPLKSLDQLLALRRDLGWRGLLLDRPPHATYDPPHVRSEILANIATRSADQLRIDATVLHKTRAPTRRGRRALRARARRSDDRTLRASRRRRCRIAPLPALLATRAVRRGRARVENALLEHPLPIRRFSFVASCAWARNLAARPDVYWNQWMKLGYGDDHGHIR